MADYLIWLLSVCGCGSLFVGLGIYAAHRKTPIHFWADTKVLPEQLVDITGYNRENGVMWIIYGILFFVIGFLYFLWPVISIVLLILSAILGIPLLIMNYRRIWNKYRK